MGALVNRDEIRLAMLGMVDGNGHPYSWSAIFNGYHREAMADCPFAGISRPTCSKSRWRRCASPARG